MHRSNMRKRFLPFLVVFVALTAIMMTVAFAECHVTESVSKRGMEKVRPGKDGKASHIKGNSERA